MKGDCTGNGSYGTLFLHIGEVEIEVRWEWDGISTYPECDGPLVNAGTGQDRWAIRASNTGIGPWYAHTLNKQGNPKVFTLDAGQEVFLSAQMASASGYSVISDFNNVVMVRGITGEAHLIGQGLGMRQRHPAQGDPL